MKKFFNAVINDRAKERKWYNTNYFYATTLLFVAAWLVCYFVFKTQDMAYADENHLLNILWFIHESAPHVIFNCIMLFLSCIFLERHFGSFFFFVIIVFITPISYMIRIAYTNYSGAPIIWHAAGGSLLTFMLMGIYFMVLMFHFKHYVLSKHAIWVFIPLVLNLLLTCFEVTTISSFSDIFKNLKFTLFWAFKTNMAGHTATCIGGLVIGTILMIGEVLGNRFGSVEHVAKEKKQKKVKSSLEDVNLVDTPAPAEQPVQQNIEQAQEQPVEQQVEQPIPKPNLPPPPPYIANLQNPYYQEQPQDQPQQPTDNQ